MVSKENILFLVEKKKSIWSREHITTKLSFCHATVCFTLCLRKGKEIAFNLVILFYVQPSFLLSSCHHIHSLDHLFLPHRASQPFYHQETDEIGWVYFWVTVLIKLPCLVEIFLHLKCYTILYNFMKVSKPLK